MSINAVYNTKILDYAGNIGRIGVLNAPDGSAKAHSKLCGSTVSVDIKIDGQHVVDYAQDVKACALGQASASIIAANIVGATGEELHTALDQFRAMLKEEGPAPVGRFEELKFLEPVREYRARHASTLLALEAAVEAFDQATNAQNAA